MKYHVVVCLRLSETRKLLEVMVKQLLRLLMIYIVVWCDRK
jgi:hypothetical protein